MTKETAACERPKWLARNFRLTPVPAALREALGLFDFSRAMFQFEAASLPQGNGRGKTQCGFPPRHNVQLLDSFVTYSVA